MEDTRSIVDTDRPHDRDEEPRPVDDPAGGLPLFDRQWRIESLARRLRVLAGDLDRGSLTARTDIADGVLLPLLRHLGWNVEDRSVVTPGFETPAGAVDFALCHPPDHPRILVGVGALPGSAAAPCDHPFHDCSIQAIQLAVSEDGRRWRFHFPAGRGSIRNREFARCHIVDDAREDVAEALDTYLSCHSVKPGEAFRQAELDYRDRRFPAEARGAWRRSVAGREVIRRFLREMEETVGVPADRRRALGFVRGQLSSVRWPPDPPDPKPARRVEVGDRVWVYNFESREIVVRMVVGSEPDWDKGEVSRDSAIGHALLGAHEGEEREVPLPGREPMHVRIVLIRSWGGQG